jgi:hypothetical protein
MQSYIFHGGKVLDVDKGELLDGVEVQVEGGRPAFLDAVIAHITGSMRSDIIVNMGTSSASRPSTTWLT